MGQALTTDQLVARSTYRYLRLILMTLPALLLVGSMLAFFWLGAIEESISEYYLGPIRDMFVGVMMAIAACLVAYRGATPLEDFSLDVAGFSAVFVALVPTDLGTTLAALDPAAREEMVAALRASCVTVLVMAVLFIALEIRLAPWRPAPLERHRPTRVASNAMNGVLVAFVALVAWRAVEGADFAWVHGLAATLLIVNLAIAVGSHAWPELAGASARPPEGASALPPADAPARSPEAAPSRSLDGASRDRRGTYRVIFWLMLAGVPLLGVLELTGWDYGLLVVEWYEIALFVRFWALETRRTWSVVGTDAGDPDPSG